MPDLHGLRICLLAGTLGQGGAERQLYYMTEALAHAGSVVQVLSLTQGEFWQTALEALGIRVRWVGRPRLRVARLAGIVAAVRRFRPNVVQSQHFYTNIYAAAAASICRIPAIGALRGFPVSEMAPHSRVVGALSLRAGALVAANSRAAVEEATRLGAHPNRLHLLPNVVDTERFRPFVENPDCPVRLLAVGRWSREKRLDRFVRILANVQRTSDLDVRGVLVGAGCGRALTLPEASSSTLTIQESVADMTEVYRQTHVVVLTSENEGTPNVVLESMACGLPVVASRVGGVPDLIENGVTGFLHDARDETAFTTTIRRLVHDPELRRVIGSQARRFVESRYDRRLLQQHLAALYDRVGVVCA